MKLRPFIIPFIIGLFSVAIIQVALQFELSPPMIVGESMQARSFPIFLMLINLILVLILTIQFLIDSPKAVPLEGFTTWGTMLLLPLFYFFTVTLDMFIGIPIIMLLMGYLWGERRAYVLIANAIVTPAIIFLLFDLILKVRFPRGVLMNWYYG